MAVGDEYLASVRHSVRLSSTVHDGELTDLINAARADLVLGGVLEAKANDETDPLIKKAVTTYVKAEFGLDNEDADRLRASYKEQRNGLTLSDSYIAAEGGSLMYWRDVVTLKAVTEGRDADGFPKETITETTVFADVSSTKRSEFYAARQAGISLALTVKLRAADYDGQERLSYEGKEYKVERAYTEAREYYELNCSEFREASE